MTRMQRFDWFARLIGRPRLRHLKTVEKLSHSRRLTFQELEDRRMLALVTVINDLNLVNGNVGTAETITFDAAFDGATDAPVIVDVEAAIVRTPSSTDGVGQVETLPADEVWIHEWDAFWLEIFAQVRDTEIVGIETLSADVNYNSDYFTATSKPEGHQWRCEYAPSIHSVMRRPSIRWDDLYDVIQRVVTLLELAHAAATRRADHEPSDTEGNGEHTQPTQQQITITDIEDALQRKALLYDKNSDQHYDYISAWIKSTRGSDPDASLYYLAAMLEGGENPRFIARRMVILASEDIGNADPAALPLAVSAAQAVEHVGLPECQFALAQAAIYLSLAPKSNSATQAITKARQHIRNEGAKRAPDQLRHQTPPQARDQANQASYDSPHKHPGHINQQEHLPRGRENLRFYDPDTAEQKLSERLQQVRAHRRKTTP